MSEPNFSTTLTIVRNFLGPTARIWRRERVTIGTERNGVKTVKGEGANLTEAMRNAFPEVFEALDARMAHIRELIDNAQKAVKERVEQEVREVAGE
jgi:hypothetical protein